MSQKLHKQIKDRFQKRHQQAVKAITGKHPVTQKLLTQAKQLAGNTSATITSSVAAGALTGALMLSPVPSKPLLNGSTHAAITTNPVSSKKILIPLLTMSLPANPRALTTTEEEKLEKLISSILDINVTAELDGKRLNTTYGIMGIEQHLLRFPGDTASQHNEIPQAGITPKTGAWGYMTNSKNTLTEEQILQEKYYFAVQTFYSPGWQENMYQLKDWFKYRKMVAVNPKTGDAVVGVIGDAGPAAWTGKQFGGSPEIIHDLSLEKTNKGEILLFFVDDPNNEIPLGPIN